MFARMTEEGKPETASRGVAAVVQEKKMAGLIALPSTGESGKALPGADRFAGWQKGQK